MSEYDKIRETYRPEVIKYLLIMESPPPSKADISSSRHFYRAEYQKGDDRVFFNTIKSVFAEAEGLETKQVEADKGMWLKKLQSEGYYLIEALQTSQQHQVTKDERRSKLADNAPELIKRVGELAMSDTKLILIKSNVFDMLAEPLRAAGFNVLNTELLDYPGRFNQADYRRKLLAMVRGN